MVSVLPSYQKLRAEEGELSSRRIPSGRLTSICTEWLNWTFWPAAFTCSRQISPLKLKAGVWARKSQAERKTLSARGEMVLSATGDAARSGVDAGRLVWSCAVAHPAHASSNPLVMKRKYFMRLICKV